MLGCLVSRVRSGWRPLRARGGPRERAGETSSTVVAAAIGNAIFDATGARVRKLPFTRERINTALRARA